MKKLIFALLSCTLLLASCGTSSPEPTADPVSIEDNSEKTVAVPDLTDEPEEPIAEAEPEEEAEETSNEITEEVTPEQFIADVQNMIQGDVGSGETITDVKLDGGKLYVYVDFSDGDFSTFSAAEIARSRTSSITDDILTLDKYDSLWDSIVIDFGSIGYVENSQDAIKDEGYGRFFDLNSSFSDDHLDDDAVIVKTEPATKQDDQVSVSSGKSSGKKSTPDNPPSIVVEEPAVQADPIHAEAEPQPEEPAPIEEAPVLEEEQQQPTGEMVWLSATGEKYHSINNCGRMNPDKARQVTLEDAKNQGFEPCSKCH